MGVNCLWKILESFCGKVSLDWKSLNGKILAVDLSFWIVEASTAMKIAQMQDPSFRPYLRNTFFRIKHLLSLGVLLVFVIDGAPPPQKFETLKKRGVFGNNSKKRESLKKFNNSHFRRACKECIEMLKYLGIPYIDLEFGEAEAYCALLNKLGYVDGVLTPDGDAFLFGAKTVYSDYQKTNSEMKYCHISPLIKHLQLTQSNFIAIALILGSDYTLQSGVKGIGEKRVIKLFQESIEKYGNSNQDWLENMKYWVNLSQSQYIQFIDMKNNNDNNNNNNNKKSSKKSVVEKFIDNIRVTYSNDLNFFNEIIDAYLNPFFSKKDSKKLKCKEKNKRPGWLTWDKPDLINLRQFGDSYLQMECKLMDRHCLDMSFDFHLNFLFTNFDNNNNDDNNGGKSFDFIIENIVKKRRKNKIDMFSVLYQCINIDIKKNILETNEDLKCEGIHFAETMNELQYNLVKEFENSEMNKKTAKKTTAKKKANSSKKDLSNNNDIIKTQRKNKSKTKNESSQNKNKNQNNNNSQSHSLKKYFESENKKNNKTKRKKKNQNNISNSNSNESNIFRKAYDGAIVDISDSSSPSSHDSPQLPKKRQKLNFDISNDIDARYCQTNINMNAAKTDGKKYNNKYSKYSKFNKFINFENYSQIDMNNPCLIVQNNRDKIGEINQLLNQMSNKKHGKKKKSVKMQQEEEEASMHMGQVLAERNDKNESNMAGPRFHGRKKRIDGSNSQRMYESSSSSENESNCNNKKSSKRKEKKRNEKENENMTVNKRKKKSKAKQIASKNEIDIDNGNDNNNENVNDSGSETESDLDMQLSLRDRLNQRKKSKDSLKSKLKSESQLHDKNTDENICELSNLMGNLSIVNDLSKISEEGNYNNQNGSFCQNMGEFNVAAALNMNVSNHFSPSPAINRCRRQSNGNNVSFSSNKNGWICNLCTFDNHCNDLKCAMCETDKPNDFSNSLNGNKEFDDIAASGINNQFNAVNSESSSLSWKCNFCHQKLPIDLRGCPNCM